MCETGENMLQETSAKDNVSRRRNTLITLIHLGRDHLKSKKCINRNSWTQTIKVNRPLSKNTHFVFSWLNMRLWKVTVHLCIYSNAAQTTAGIQYILKRKKKTRAVVLLIQPVQTALQGKILSTCVLFLLEVLWASSVRYIPTHTVLLPSELEQLQCSQVIVAVI